MNKLPTDPATEQQCTQDPDEPAEDVLFSFEVNCSLDTFHSVLELLARRYPEGWASSDGTKLHEHNC